MTTDPEYAAIVQAKLQRLFEAEKADRLWRTLLTETGLTDVACQDDLETFVAALRLRGPMEDVAGAMILSAVTIARTRQSIRKDDR